MASLADQLSATYDAFTEKAPASVKEPIIKAKEDFQKSYVRPVFDQFGHDLKTRNGDDSFAVPIPATILVDNMGTVCNTFIEPDYTKRLEPAVALQWADAL